MESLRGLTAERLAALNHGTIKTPIPGREGPEVLRRVKNWAASVGEVRIGEEANPTITVQLSGVDTETILAQARREDNTGNRRRRVRQLLFEQLGIDDADQMFVTHGFKWRNTDRACDVVFGNVRELLDASLVAGDRWKLVIDFPFDEGGHTPRSDLARLQQYREHHPEGTSTLVWLPNFFSPDALKDLGTLVVLEHVLTGERFAGYVSHLSPEDRPAARTLLDNQCSVLRQRVRSHLEAAYGLESALSGGLDQTHELEPQEQFQSFKNGFDPRRPAAASLKAAMEQLLDQALADDYPAHPRFEAEVKASNLNKVWAVVGAAGRSEDGRVAVDKPLRPLVRQIANPLLLGEMGADATHFVLGQHWKYHFTKKAAETGASLTVGQLRAWLDEPRPMGLPRDAANLVILTFAEQTNQTFHLHGGPPQEGALTNLPDVLELREERLPPEAVWAVAVQRAAVIFGVAVSPLRKAGNVASLASQVKAKATDWRLGCQSYSQRLRDRLGRLGIADAPRLKTSQATLALLDRLHAADLDGVAAGLAGAVVSTSEAAMSTCAARAAELAGCLETFWWGMLEAVAQLADGREAEAAEINRIVREAITADEHAAPLAPALKEAQAKAERVLTRSSPPVSGSSVLTPAVSPPVRVPALAPSSRRTVDQGQREKLSLATARELLEQIGEQAAPGRTVEVSIAWRVEEGGTGP